MTAVSDVTFVATHVRKHRCLSIVRACRGYMSTSDDASEARRLPPTVRVYCCCIERDTCLDGLSNQIILIPFSSINFRSTLFFSEFFSAGECINYFLKSFRSGSYRYVAALLAYALRMLPRFRAPSNQRLQGLFSPLWRIYAKLCRTGQPRGHGFPPTVEFTANISFHNFHTGDKTKTGHFHNVNVTPIVVCRGVAPCAGGLVLHRAYDTLAKKNNKSV